MITSLLVSCNNDQVASNENTMPAKEQQMKSLISKYPDSTILEENLIQYYRENGDYSQAIKETDKSIKKYPASDRFWDIKGTLAYENADTPTAVNAFIKAIEIKPDPNYLISLGSLYAQTKNPEAIKIADALISQPNASASKQGMFIKGIYYRFTADRQHAIACFDSCLSIDYTNTMAYREKAICLYELGKFDVAIIELKKAVAVQDTFDEGYYWLGRCYEKMGLHNEAVSAYRQALQIDPEYIEAQDGLARLGVK
jgi:tetratricopeptide (TPR) repeat protein